MAARAAKSAPRARGRNGSQDADRVRERILEAFSAKARRSGIRSVVMGELASELRMSAMTLYKHFASKDDLVTAVVDAWALELAAIDALEWDKIRNSESALEVLFAWADVWTGIMSTVSPAFFDDLRRDHPTAWERFARIITERKESSQKYLLPFIRPDVHPVAALFMLDHLVTHAADPGFAEQFGISRQESVRTAISLWGGGALLERTILPGRDVPRTPAAPKKRKSTKSKRK